MAILDTIPTSSPMPSSGYGPLRASLDPNDLDYRKKLALVGALEGHHELASQPPPTPSGTLGAIPNAPPSVNQAHPTVPAQPADTSAAPTITSGPGPSLLDVTGKPLPTGDADYIQGVAKPKTSLLGKIGHGLETAGNIAGDVFAPESMALIPGTQLYKERVGNERFKQNLAQEQLAQKPELAELRGEIEGNQAAQRAQNQEQLQNERLTDTDKRAAQAHDWQSELERERQQFEGQVKDKTLAQTPFNQWLSNPKVYDAYLEAQAKAKKQGGNILSPYAAVKLADYAYLYDPRLMPFANAAMQQLSQQLGMKLPEGVNISTPAAGQPSNAAGQTIGLHQPEAPTAATRGRGQFAESVIPTIEDAKQEVAKLADKIGPGAGRLYDIYTNKAGFDSPEFAGLSTDLHNIATAWMRLHANSDQAREDFTNQLKEAQSPDDLVSRLDRIERQAKGYVNEGAGNPPANGAEPTKPPKVGDILYGYKFKGGDPNDQKNWVKQ